MEKGVLKYKSIRVDPDVYRRLSDYRRGGETFSEVLDRIFIDKAVTLSAARDLFERWGGKL